jgi:hypothetical protein
MRGPWGEGTIVIVIGIWAWEGDPFPHPQPWPSLQRGHSQRAGEWEGEDMGLALIFGIARSKRA